MIECHKCGAKYPTERLFCGKCKEPLGVRCPVCGFINLLDDLFCGICLTELKAQAEVSSSRESKEFASLPIPYYEEIQTDGGEDEDFISADNKLSQEEIKNIFQKDEES
jgi:hypothetical protein